jgi:prefoldin subunit 5
MGTRAASRLRARVAELAKTIEQLKDELERLRRAS